MMLKSRPGFGPGFSAVCAMIVAGLWAIETLEGAAFWALAASCWMYHMSMGEK